MSVRVRGSSFLCAYGIRLTIEKGCQAAACSLLENEDIPIEFSSSKGFLNMNVLNLLELSKQGMCSISYISRIEQVQRARAPKFIRVSAHP